MVGGVRVKLRLQPCLKFNTDVPKCCYEVKAKFPRARLGGHDVWVGLPIVKPPNGGIEGGILYHFDRFVSHGSQGSTNRSK